ncbi:MAG: peptide-methionine (S)-S-oxide reductase MsrA [Pyrinomonadaceae bacterium]
MRTVRPFLTVVTLLTLGCLLSCGSVRSSGDPEAMSVPQNPETAEVDPAKLKKAVFAGGCFWGVEGVFERTKGVKSARSGYAGGTAKSANYDEVSAGSTEHAEAVEVVFDPASVSYDQLLEVFFKVIHDPTELNRQGPDVGPQYRSAIFYADEEQKKAVSSFIAGLTESRLFEKPIVTQVVPLEKFYPAEDYHQDFMTKNPDHPYIVYHDVPKVEKLKKKYPALYVKD